MFDYRALAFYSFRYFSFCFCDQTIRAKFALAISLLTSPPCSLWWWSQEPFGTYWYWISLNYSCSIYYEPFSFFLAVMLTEESWMIFSYWIPEWQIFFWQWEYVFLLCPTRIFSLQWAYCYQWWPFFASCSCLPWCLWVISIGVFRLAIGCDLWEKSF